MIDNAFLKIQDGQTIATERISGVNDNMCTSHYHDFYEIYYLESGERYHLINDDLYQTLPGELVIFEPYALHHSYGDKDVAFCRLLIYFRKEEINSLEIKELLTDSTGVYQLSSKENQIFYQLMNMIYQEQESSPSYSNEFCKNLLTSMLIVLFRNKHKRKKQAQRNLITDVISYINMNYEEEITLEGIAKNFYISPFHLCREFKFYTNTSIIQYVNTTRIIKAQQLLMNTDMSITDIASNVGFSNITHFGRIFKKLTTKTPSEFRKGIVLS